MGSFSEYADEVRRTTKPKRKRKPEVWPPPTEQEVELERLPDWCEGYLREFDAFLRGDAAARARMSSIVYGNNPGLRRERVAWDRREAA